MYARMFPIVQQSFQLPLEPERSNFFILYKIYILKKIVLFYL